MVVPFTNGLAARAREVKEPANASVETFQQLAEAGRR